LFVGISQVIGCEDRLRNDLYCVECGVELYCNQTLLSDSHAIAGVTVEHHSRSICDDEDTPPAAAAASFYNPLHDDDYSAASTNATLNARSQRRT